MSQLATNKKQDLVKREYANRVGDLDTMNEGTAALETSKRKGPATDVVFNPVTGRLELVRPTASV